MTCEKKMNPFLLIKLFSELEHANNFLNKGEIHFGPISFFNNYESEQNHQMDEFEGHDLLYDSKFIELDWGGIKLRPAENSTTKIKLSNGHPYTHICSFAVIYDHFVIVKNKEYLFDPKMYEFGESFIFLHFGKMKIFLNKVIEECKKLNLGYKCGFVKYTKINNQNGEWGPFKKRSSYSYQTEYRIALTGSPRENNNLYVGNLKELFYGPIHKDNCNIEVINGSVNL